MIFELELKRIALKDTYTIGKLYINGQYFCDTLEDKVRKDGVKVYGETAIPKGIYNVIVNMSNRFKRFLPLLLNVPMFEGIRIHAGNTKEDTHGCILLGENKKVGELINSKKYADKLTQMLLDYQKTGGKITIKIS